MSKQSRNEPCSCGSGHKFKHCCGAAGEALRRSARRSPIGLADPITAIQFKSIEEALRRQQLKQGFIPSMKAAGWGKGRVVAVGNSLYGPGTWKTFIDFLGDYMRIKFTPEWGNAEIAKPANQRHPVLVWYQDVCEWQRQHLHTKDADGIFNGISTGSVNAYYSLAYDLYVLQHLSLLQPTLLKRLRVKEQFHGARYEAFVATTFLRSGFKVEFENEKDDQTTHCEFTATDRKTKRSFSVEAKTRGREGVLGKAGEFQDPLGDPRIYRPLQAALLKKAKHERVIFIDVNMPPDDAELFQKDWFREASKSMRNLEDREDPARPYPPAFVFLTNRPDHYVRNASAEPGKAYVFTAIKRPEFKREDNRHLIERAHPEFREIMMTLEYRNSIPNTFE